MRSHKLILFSLLSSLLLSTTAFPIPIPTTPNLPQHEQWSPQVPPTPDELLAAILAGETPHLPPKTHVPVAGAAQVPAGGSNHALSRAGGLRGKPAVVVGPVDVKPVTS